MSISLIFYSVVKPYDVELERIGEGLYSFYSTEKVESEHIARCIDLGYSYIYECDSSVAAQVRELFTKIDGESIKIEGRSDVRRILDKFSARIVADSNYGVFAYSPKFNKFITDNGRKINLQIVRNNEFTIVGFPVILGAY